MAVLEKLSGEGPIVECIVSVYILLSSVIKHQSGI